MSSWVPHVLVLVIALNVVSAETVDDASHEETERIIQGEEAVAGQFPYTVALHLYGSFICSASVISSSAVLTAGHCVVSKGVTQPAEAFYGIRNVSRSAGSVRIEFSKVIPHPEYDDRSLENDIAIMKTKDAIEFSKTENVQVVYIAPPDRYNYEYATAMGWGDVAASNLRTVIPDKLHYVEEEIIDNDWCSVSYGLTYVRPNKICTKGGFNGICNGDSGGPLVHNSQSKCPVQIGVASYINSRFRCWSITAAVFTRVSSFYGFIEKNAGYLPKCNA